MSLIICRHSDSPQGVPQEDYESDGSLPPFDREAHAHIMQAVREQTARQKGKKRQQRKVQGGDVAELVATDSLQVSKEDHGRNLPAAGDSTDLPVDPRVAVLGRLGLPTPCVSPPDSDDDDDEEELRLAQPAAPLVRCTTGPVCAVADSCHQVLDDDGPQLRTRPRTAQLGDVVAPAAKAARVAPTRMISATVCQVFSDEMYAVLAKTAGTTSATATCARTPRSLSCRCSIYTYISD